MKYSTMLVRTALATVLLVSSLSLHGIVVTATEKVAANSQVKWNGTITIGSFIDQLAKVVPVDKESLLAGQKVDAGLSVQTAVSLTVKAADLKELAYTYSEEKTGKALERAKIVYKKDGSIDLKSAQSLAVAIDLDIISPFFFPDLAANQAVTAEQATHLIEKVLELKGKSKNYLGKVSDEDIYGKLYHAWEASNLMDAPELRKVVDQVLKSNVITGYNLKDTRFHANFDPELSLTYGHSEITHAIQLVGLLHSEGLDATVQFEPKTSAFIYLKEWGEPKETPDYKVVQIENGNYIAYAKEYDISFEFSNQKDKERFDTLINKYAKKNEENQQGLLLGSWWQPLYSSRVEVTNYKEIANNVITKGSYIAQSFSLSEKSSSVISEFKKLDSTVEITVHPLWVDQPFYNYLVGEYK